MNKFKKAGETKIWKKRQRNNNKNQYKQMQISKRKVKNQRHQTTGHENDKQQQFFGVPTKMKIKGKVTNDDDERRVRPLPKKIKKTYM